MIGRFIVLGAAMLCMVVAPLPASAQTLHRTSEPTRVEIQHLHRHQKTRILAQPDDLRVHVAGEAAGSGMKPRQVRSEGQDLIVSLPFPLSQRRSYRVTHPALSGSLVLSGTSGAASPPRITAFEPSAEELPANALRFTLVFSEPMAANLVISESVFLVDLASGQRVPAAFLDLDTPLFDASQTRLTVVFNPGRVKREVGSNKMAGAPLVAGRRYAVELGTHIRDAEGEALDAPFRHVFSVVPAQRERIDISQWRMTLPAAGTNQTLEVAFDRVMDPFQIDHRIVVRDPNGAVLRHRADPEGRHLEIQPEAPWVAGPYSMVVHPELEDVSGNRPIRAFDQKADDEVPQCELERNFVLR